jgi:hypothetical protein
MSVAGTRCTAQAARCSRPPRACAGSAACPSRCTWPSHADEDQILLTGENAFLDLLKARGVLSGYDAPGVRPVPLARELGLMDADTLLVHCVTVDGQTLRTSRTAGPRVPVPAQQRTHRRGPGPARALWTPGSTCAWAQTASAPTPTWIPTAKWPGSWSAMAVLDLPGRTGAHNRQPRPVFRRTIAQGRAPGQLGPRSAGALSIVPAAILDIWIHR